MVLRHEPDDRHTRREPDQDLRESTSWRSAAASGTNGSRYLSDRSPDQISFTNLATAVYDPTTGANYGAKPNTGYADADFFLGAASSYSQNKNAPFNQAQAAGVRLYTCRTTTA